MNEPYDEDEQYEPTPAEKRMANSINYIVGAMLRGELSGIALCAVNTEGEDSCFYLNKPDKPALREAMQKLKVMYETNQSFRTLDNSPMNNRSFRSH
jgi:hypothetical protein